MLDQTAGDLITSGVNALVSPKHLEACVGDGITDDTVRFNEIYKYAQDNRMPLIIPETGNSYRLSRLEERHDVDFYGIDKRWYL